MSNFNGLSFFFFYKMSASLFKGSAVKSEIIPNQYSLDFEQLHKTITIKFEKRKVTKYNLLKTIFRVLIYPICN